MNLEIITREEFNSFKQEVLEALKPISTGQNKQFLRSREMREMFNISAGTLQNMRINGTLPYSKVGTTILYDYDVVLAILKENRVN
ncbi:helix-turn-helix domain-containing protein [Flavobacterium caseinilyticum]|uniref:DNA-binding protein n=1 Tax=Flavobacterium caseinilyticum TaxID=2541732 RepID=A0A4R5AYQ6_9FLAO|nr:helix-turn-helix domain-containing protein [Flavobacterium caseinilyticum]TDD75832.1 DNA-binding protein [Flavobacterium caseinilyticum]